MHTLTHLSALALFVILVIAALFGFLAAASTAAEQVSTERQQR